MARAERLFGAASEKDQEYDFYHWARSCAAVSGFEIYRKVYRDVITPERVAELLILRPDMPRSLHRLHERSREQPEQVANDQSAETERFAGKLHARTAVRAHRRDPGDGPA